MIYKKITKGAIRTDSREFDHGKEESLAIALEELAHVAGDIVGEDVPVKLKVTMVVRWAKKKRGLEVYYLNYRELETLAFVDPWWKTIIRKIFRIY